MKARFPSPRFLIRKLAFFQSNAPAAKKPRTEDTEKSKKDDESDDEEGVEEIEDDEGEDE